MACVNSLGESPSEAEKREKERERESGGEKVWGQKSEREREQHLFNLNKTNEYITGSLLSVP